MFALCSLQLKPVRDGVVSLTFPFIFESQNLPFGKNVVDNHSDSKETLTDFISQPPPF